MKYIDVNKLNFEWELRSGKLKNKQILCLRPSAKCMFSGKRLFLRRCYYLSYKIYGLAGEDPVTIVYYVGKQEYAMWCLMNL